MTEVTRIANPCKIETDTPTPEAVAAQYRRAISGVVEMVRFGAMLMQVDASLTRETGGRLSRGGNCDGPTLKGWLEANCPDVNYKTALRFLRLAEQVRTHCKLPAKVPLSLALPADDGAPVEDVDAESIPVAPAKLRKLREDVWTMIDGKSARQLEFEFRADTPRGGDRRSGQKLSEEEKYLRLREAARDHWSDTIDGLAVQVKRHQSHLLLDAALAAGLADRLTLIRDALRDAAAGGATPTGRAAS